MGPGILISSAFAPAAGLSGYLRTLNGDYACALSEAGAQPVLALGGDPAFYAGRFDGLLLSGGGDVAPSLFGEERYNGTVEVDERRDREELALFSAFARSGRPVLGICRGIQLIDVALGGTLWQDLPAQCPEASPHGGGAVHPVRIRPETALYALFGGRITANSYHHQAVRQCGRGLRTAAESEDGQIEAVEHESLPVYGVQWHPERMRRAPDGRLTEMAPLFAWFAGLCAQRAGR